MIPLTLAYKVKDEVYNYLKVLWEIKANKSGVALEKYYKEDSPLVKGPFIQLRLPYEPVSSDEPLKLKVKPNFPPYKHQKNAFDRLFYKEAKNTVVTTGTGSGKTECFMFPVLDYVKAMKDEGKKGVKAIILYPMNALLDDQAKRFCEEIKDQGLEDLNIRVGKYTGNRGNQKQMDYDNSKVINDVNVLASDPPDILMTNYKMLDYMLFREKEKAFWSKDTQEVLKYLVLDEMHTFDGASGADVACLIRRLKMVALKEKSDQLVCVGTSATLSSSPNAKTELCEFASSLFGSKFEEDAIVGEIKHTTKTYLGKITNTDIPEEFKRASFNSEIASYHLNDTVEDYLKRIAAIFGMESYLDKPSKLAEELSKLEIVHLLVEATDKTGMKSVDDIVTYFKENHAKYLKECGKIGFVALVKSVVSLCSYARSKENEKFPFLTIKCSLWVQEMKRVLRKVVNEEIGEPFFIDEDKDIPKNEKFLPAIYCTFCGEAGWLTTHEDIDEDRAEIQINFNPREIGQASLTNKAYALFPYNEKQTENAYYFYPREDKLFKKEQRPVEGLSDDLNTSIRLIKVSQADGYCPCCDTKLDSRSFSASGTQLTSLIAEEYFANQLNEDKKMISFSDSVQDATFNAANINDRTYKFTLKRFIEKKLVEGKNLVEICESFIDKEAIKKMSPAERTELVGKFIPDKLKKKWQINFKDFNFKKNEYSVEMVNTLVDIIYHEIFGQFTFDARIGWSFENIGHSGFYLSENDWSDVFSEYSHYFENVDNNDALVNTDKFKSFLLGVIQRFKHQGIVYTPFLDGYYNDHNADYYVASRRYPDLGLMSMRTNQPMFFTTNTKPSYGKKRRTFQAIGKGQSWYYRWVRKYAEVNRVHELYEGICSLLVKKGILQVVGEGIDKNGPRFVLNPEKLLYTKNVKTLRCDKCQHVHTVADYLEDCAESMPCFKNNCDGSYKLFDNQASKKYFEEYYAVKPYRINAFEHTGGLDSTIKEYVEDEFKSKKSSTPSHDINYLSCTPTMEMGIDIGNLSSVLLKSVPKNAASYLQRVGRSGRTTGNSLDFLIIDKNPHNLYFWENPYKLLNWEVVSPACRYKTGHILKRQFNAFCLDQYLHDESAESMVKDIPATLGWIFKDDEKSANARLYWKGFYQYAQDKKDDLLKAYIKEFGLRAGEHALNELTKYVEADSVKNEFESAFSSLKEYIQNLKDEAHLFKVQIQAFKKEDFTFFDKIEKGHRGEEGFDLGEILGFLPEDAQNELKKFYADYRSANKKIKEFGKKSLLGVLADKGVLPGYAFPESGCELEISVKKPQVSGVHTSVKDVYHKIEVTRAAETAIRELAPFNTFYTHGFKGKVDRLGLYGKKDAITELGICDHCGHASKKKVCEVCGNGVELDKVYDFKKAISSNDFNQSYIEGFADRRERENYDVSKHFLFDAKIHEDERQRISYVNTNLNFGFEFQSNVEIITLNNGQKHFGKEGKGFKVCEGCGAVENPKETKKRQKQGKEPVNHFRNCPNKTKPLTEIKLHRKIKSDAIRFTMPSAIFSDTLKAILYLGIKTHLKGDVGHIKVGDYEQGENKYLVIYDDVPGGTGHLRDFLKISLDQNASSEIVPKTFYSILKDVKAELEKCPCDNGCYSCLWGAHNAVRRESVSKQTAFIWLNRILSGKEEDFQRKEDLGLYNISEEQSFDGQTEIIFYQILEYLGQHLTNPNKSFELKPVAFGNDKQSAEIIYKEKKLTIESSPYSKVDLTESGIYTKPDFTLYNEDGSYAAFIYTDGRDPHLNPGQDEPTFVNDIKLRDELFKQEKVPVLTFTYEMLQHLWKRIEDSKNINEDFNFVLKGADYDDKSNGVLDHHLLAKHSFVTLFKFLELALDDGKFSKDEGALFQKWLFEYKNNNIVNFESSTATINIRTDQDIRCEKSNGNIIITNQYELHWSNFWYIFNMYSMIGKIPMKFEV
jgi:DEAD/DEAH box helicase domain-containing protein